MPCDSVTTQSVNLANAQRGILTDALKADGWTIQQETNASVRARRGYSEALVWTAGQGLKVTGNRNERTIQDVTKAYSRQAVTWAAQRAGWTVEQTGQNTLSVTRR